MVPANWYVPWDVHMLPTWILLRATLTSLSSVLHKNTLSVSFVCSGSTGKAGTFWATALVEGLSSLKWILKERSSILIQLWQNFWVRENVWLENVRFRWREDTAHHFKCPQWSSVQWLWWTVCIIDLSWSHHTHTHNNRWVCSVLFILLLP